MAYIGRPLVQGTYIKLDSIASLFDGSTKTFSLKSGGASYKPGSAATLLVSLAGTIQEAQTAYSVSNDEITFTSAPTSGQACFIIALGSSVSIGVPADGSVTLPKLASNARGVGIQSSGTIIGTGVTGLNFIGVGNTFVLNGSVVDVSISGGGAGAGGTWATYTAGIATNKYVGVNTSTLDDKDLTGVGNSFAGLYISNGMLIVDNELNGSQYIGTAFNGLMAGPVTVNGVLSVDGNYVVV